MGYKIAKEFMAFYNYILLTVLFILIGFLVVSAKRKLVNNSCPLVVFSHGGISMKTSTSTVTAATFLLEQTTNTYRTKIICTITGTSVIII
jgi:hypothetical protein